MYFAGDHSRWRLSTILKAVWVVNSWRSSSRLEVLDNHNMRASTENQHYFGKILHDRSEDVIDTKNSNCLEFGLGENNAIGLSVEGAMHEFK